MNEITKKLHNLPDNIKNFYINLYSRRSVREFSTKPINNETLDRLMMTLQRAQSATNAQPWYFYIIKDKLRPSLNTVFRKEGFKKAPVIIAACAKPEDSWVRKDDDTNFSWVDLSIAITEMISAATSEGIGSCWIASFEMDKAKEIIGIPDNLQLVTLVALGYPQQPLKLEEKKRKPVSEIITIL